MSERSPLADTNGSRLLAKKSSYQAWKCVSFACSLLALLLLLAKWQEISSDLQLLLNIEHLVGGQQQFGANNGTAAPTDQLPATATTSAGDIASQWPPASLPEPPLAEDPQQNETLSSSSMDTNNRHQLMVSHMHISVSRELQGNQMLKQEIATFIAEFRGAKSIVSLSSLLVSVYIISWILMTLAINDARISNDISLRNILLLSVFGAIDMAASLGFVLVRLIMYSVKNSSFRGDMLASAGLKDTPIRMAPDQLTAFTALRLIAMRSCSAYMDIYVSFIVVLLTVLRLYAILQALAYYRQMRRPLAGHQELSSRPHTAGPPPPQQWLLPGRESPQSRGPKQVWSLFSVQQQPQPDGTFASYHSAPAGAQQAMISGQLSPQTKQQQQPAAAHMISQHPGYSLRHSATMGPTSKRPTSRSSWQQQQPQPPPRPLRPLNRRPTELLLVDSKARLRRQQLDSRSPSPLGRQKFQYQRRQLRAPESEPEAAARRPPKRLADKPLLANGARPTDTLRASDGTTYTLLSADQLERISRKLLEAAHDVNNNNSAGNKQSSGAGKGASRESDQTTMKRRRAPPPRNNFELLLSGAGAEEPAGEQSTACSSLLEDDDDNNDDDGDDDDNENDDSDLSRAGGNSSTGDQRRQQRRHLSQQMSGAARLLSLRQVDETSASPATTYLIDPRGAVVVGKRKGDDGPTRSIQQQAQPSMELPLSSSAKSKLLLGEYFYA